MKIIRNFLSFSLLIYFIFQPFVYAEIPDRFNRIQSVKGVELWSSSGPHGTPFYVQVVKLDQGAGVHLLHATIIDPGTGTSAYSGYDSPVFERQNINEAWSDFSSSNKYASCIVNGQFFRDNPTVPTELSFPIRVNDNILSMGFYETETNNGKFEFPDKKMVLEIWNNKVDINKFDNDQAIRILNTSAPNAIVGLAVNSGIKDPNGPVGRTLVGIDDSDGDGTYETVLIFSSLKAKQSEAAETLTEFGADKMMMLDGGGSTALLCEGTGYMGGRTLPQTLGTSHACQNTSSQYSGTLSEKEVHWHPERGYYSGVLGKHIGSLSGPSNANFDLYLAMWDDLEKKWKFIAHSVPDPSRPSTEDIDYNGSYGYYSWGVYARSGSGSYHLSVCSPLE